MALTVADVLGGLDITEAEFARELATAIRADRPERRISAQMLADLQESGGLQNANALSDWSDADDRGLRFAVHASALSDLIEATMSATQAAHYLRISPSRLAHRAREVPLLSSKIGRHRRYYRWQFTGGGLVPGLGVVVDRLTGDEHPLDVAAFMTEPCEDLVGLTPVDYLASGGNPQRVAYLLVGLEM